MHLKLVCLYNGYSVPLAGFTVIIYFVLYTLVPLVGLLVETLTLVCFAAVPISSELHFALRPHAWAVPVSDMLGALRALYEVTIMQYL